MTILKLKTSQKVYNLALPYPMSLHEVREFARVYLGVQKPPDAVHVRELPKAKVTLATAIYF